MPPRLALYLCIAFILWLFWMDAKRRTLTSPALWIPALWLWILSSRPVSFWLEWRAMGTGGLVEQEGGRSIDMLVFLSLIMTAAVVLVRRGFGWGQFALRNKAVLLIYVYWLLSAIWAEHSFVTLKRVIKDFGCVIVALVLLSDKDPAAAIRVVFVRVAYVVIPLSVVLIKYFPSIGRMPFRTGDSMFIGVAGHKNSLGAAVCMLALFIVWDLVEIWKGGKHLGATRTDKYIRLGLLAVGLWLIVTCNSATALVCLVLGCGIFWGTRWLLRTGSPGQMLFCCLALMISLLTVEVTFNLSSAVFATLKRSKDLTGRTLIWERVQEHSTRPILGTGFYSFWDSRDASPIVESFGILRTAHNGFLETYLDGGIVGLCLLFGVVITWGKSSLQRMLGGTLYGRMALTLWLISLFLNNSESEFFRLGASWFTLVLMMLNYAGTRGTASRRAPSLPTAAVAQ